MLGDGALFVVDVNGDLTAFEIEDGSRRWMIPGEGEKQPATGTIVWSADTGLRLETPLPAIAQGIVVVGGRTRPAGTPWLTSGAVVALDLADGSELWRRPTAAWVAAPPAVGHGRSPT